jgi:hypothetical protein
VSNSLPSRSVDNTIFVSRLEEVQPAVELHFDPTPGFGRWAKFFPEAAVSHPAKANLNLVQFLIETWTKPGDVCLDPLAGTFSTVVLSILNQRNAIGIELEGKFVNWGRDALVKMRSIFREVEEELKRNPPLSGWCDCEADDL